MTDAKLADDQMPTVYVLIGERGEYDQFSRDVLGTFSSHEGARSAITKLRAYGAAQWALWNERDRKRKEYLARFEPVRLSPSVAFPDGYTVYTNDQYREADAACGPVPALIADADKYIIEIYSLNAIQAGATVEEIDGRQIAAPDQPA